MEAYNMNDGEETADSSSDHAIERGGWYDHAQHGRVEVTGIWHGTRWVDSVCETNEQGIIIIRYLPPEGEDWSDELSERLNGFLEAIG